MLKSRNPNLGLELPEKPPHWTFLTNHAQVLLCVAHDPDLRLREIGETVGITERAAHRIVGELVAAGYLARERIGRRNRYTVNSHLPLPDPVARLKNVGDLLQVLAGDPAAERDAAEGHDQAMRDIEIRGHMIRLGQLLKLSALAGSGADARSLLVEHAVTVNGEPEARRGRQLHRGDVVTVGGESLRVT